MDERLAKRERFREAGEAPYGADPGFSGRRLIAPLLEQDPDTEPRITAVVAGRIIARRDHGNSLFLDLRDVSGRMQVFLAKKVVGPERFALFKENLDLGDFVSVSGEYARTRMGEPTLFVEGIRLLTKSMVAPPKEHYGLADVETRYRRRYVDLAANEDSFQRFRLRSRIVTAMRGALEAQGFMEVETPLLHTIAGGATAKPFITHHNKLDMDLYLRIAPELFLKRLLVGGYERVYEIGRSFRNEGLSPRHNPEFTMLEAYWAYARAEDWMRLTESMLEALVREHGERGRLRQRPEPGPVDEAGEPGVEVAAGGPGDELPPLEPHQVLCNGRVLDLKAPFPRLSYADLVREHAGVDIFDEQGVRAAARGRGIEVAGRPTAKVADDLFSECVEDKLWDPVFVVDFPLELSPLAKASPDEPKVAERFELFMGGMEVANGFSELNDPDDQLARFEEQVATKDPELPAEVDRDYVEALRYGFPPSAGIGIGIDRLVMLLTNTPTIRDVILFPLLRPATEAT